MTELNLADIEFLITFILKFENLNNISINVYSIEDKQILPLWFIDNKKEKCVNLLYLQNSTTTDTFRGSRTCRVSQISEKKNKKFFCDR